MRYSRTNLFEDIKIMIKMCFSSPNKVFIIQITTNQTTNNILNNPAIYQL